MIKQQHIIINDYNVNTVYDTYDQCTVTCLILVRHNRIRANTTYYYLSGIPYPVSLIRYTVPGYARQKTRSLFILSGVERLIVTTSSTN